MLRHCFFFNHLHPFVSLIFFAVHNNHVVVRPSDNAEVPQLLKQMTKFIDLKKEKVWFISCRKSNFYAGKIITSLLYDKHNRDGLQERPLCHPYSLKARALLYAHMNRMELPADTLDQDRLFIVKCAPQLIGEMVTCISQLIMLAHAKRISQLPKLTTIEATMKLAPHIVQVSFKFSAISFSNNG